MRIESRQEILEILRMPFHRYADSILPYAKNIYLTENQNRLIGTAMLGFDNYCKNRCLYCGMRVENKSVKRYRISKEDVISSALTAREIGFRRVFLISGEDPAY